MSLTNKNVVVTGANGALGRAVAAQSLALGATVVGLDLGFSEAQESVTTSETQKSVTTSEAQKRVTAKTVNLLDLAATQQVFAEIGKVDAVFNVAGGFAMGTPAYAEDEQEWDKMFAINVATLRNVVKAVVPGMVDSGAGSIVNIGAFGALKGQPEMSAYTASKSVVMRLTESLSGELKHKGINVNAVLPTVIDTPANRAAMPDEDFSQWVSPSDLANVICFLGSDAANAVHGALIPVTGLV